MTRRWWRLDDWFRVIRHDGAPMGGGSRPAPISAPSTVKVAVGALVLTVLTVPLFVGLAFVLDRQSFPKDQLSGIAVSVALLLTSALLLLLGYLLLRRSRLAWLFVVGTGVFGTTAPGGVEPPALEVLGRLLGLATWLPLVLPRSLRWFWRRSHAASPALGSLPSRG